MQHVDYRVEYTRLKLEHEALQVKAEEAERLAASYKVRLSDHDLIEIVGQLAAVGWAAREGATIDDLPWESYAELCEKAATAFDKRGITPQSHS